MDFPVHELADNDVLYEVMQWLKKHHPKSLLAGGAVRDALLGQEIKDWDIYVPDVAEDENVRNEIISIMGGNGYIRNADLYVDYPEGDKTQLPRVLTFKSGSWVSRRGSKAKARKDFQFVFTNQAPYQFDISTCMAWVNTDFEIETSPLFDTSVKVKKHFVLMENLLTVEQQVICFNSHLPRVLAKYPWDAVVLYNDDTSVREEVMREMYALRQASRLHSKQMELNLKKYLPSDDGDIDLDVTSICPATSPWITPHPEKKA